MNLEKVFIVFLILILEIGNDEENNFKDINWLIVVFLENFRIVFLLMIGLLR